VGENFFGLGEEKQMREDLGGGSDESLPSFLGALVHGLLCLAVGAHDQKQQVVVAVRWNLI